MIHILRKGPHPPTRQPRSCFVEGKAPSRAAARAGKRVSREPGVRLRGRGCRGQVTRALSNKNPEPQLTNCRGSGQRPAAITQPGALHQGCCNAPTVPAGSSPAAFSPHRGGESQPQRPAKRQNPKRQGKFSLFPKQVLPPHVQEPLTLPVWTGPATPEQWLAWKCRQAPGKRAAASSLALV